MEMKFFSAHTFITPLFFLLEFTRSYVLYAKGKVASKQLATPLNWMGRVRWETNFSRTLETHTYDRLKTEHTGNK